jgi:hypothetical protein
MLAKQKPLTADKAMKAQRIANQWMDDDAQALVDPRQHVWNELARVRRGGDLACTCDLCVAYRATHGERRAF